MDGTAVKPLFCRIPRLRLSSATFSLPHQKEDSVSTDFRWLVRYSILRTACTWSAS